MLLIDDLLFGGLRFVLDKLATVVDQEMNDESRLHQTLMEAQMRFEMGEITAEEFAGIERTVIDRLSSVEISGPDSDVDVEMPAIDVEARTQSDSLAAGHGRATRSAPRTGDGAARRAKSGGTRAARVRDDSAKAGRDGRRRTRR
jgi:hypothetical protein